MITSGPDRRAQRRSARVVLTSSLPSAIRSGLGWGAIFGVIVASAAISYTQIYTTQAKRDQLQLIFGASHAASALFGPTIALNSVAGFTVFKVVMTLMVLGAIWAVLFSTKALRGEEEAGRAELLLLGQSSRVNATTQSIVALYVALFFLWAVTAATTRLVGLRATIGFSTSASMFFALAMVSSASIFLGVGALASQVAPTRRSAASLSMVVLGLSYALRMIADSSAELQWLRWSTPLGWVEQLRPFVAPTPWPLLLIGLTSFSLCAIAIWLTTQRDVGAGLRADVATAPARLRLLRSPLGLSFRLQRASLIGWLVAVTLTGLVMGFVSHAAGEVISGSSIATLLERLGIHTTGARSYLGMASLILGVLVAFLAASLTTAVRNEEASGRVDTLVCQPVTRQQWLLGRIVIIAGSTVCAGALVGLSVWLGTVLHGGTLSLLTLLAAGLNLVAPALCLAGLGIAAFGFFPRPSTGIIYGVLGWSLVVELIGGIGSLSGSLLTTSLFHHMAPAPATSPDWTAAGVMILIGVFAAVLGTIRFSRRDLLGS